MRCEIPCVLSLSDRNLEGEGDGASLVVMDFQRYRSFRSLFRVFWRKLSDVGLKTSR